MYLLGLKLTEKQLAGSRYDSGVVCDTDLEDVDFFAEELAGLGDVLLSDALDCHPLVKVL